MTATTISDADPALTVYKDEPFNAGTPLDVLRRDFTTPHSLFYARNHGSIPTIDPTSYRLTITGDVRTEISLSLDELRRDFPSETVMATLQCAGNRRAELMDIKEIPGESPWTADAIGTATWTGVPLRAVLDAAGVGKEARHSAICTPADGATIAAGRVRVAGYAFAGGNRDVARVDVSADGGKTWTTAGMAPEGSCWTWRFWDCTLDLPEGSHTLVARAYDTAANTQPEDPAPLWNFGGYMNNAWHRVTVQVR